MKSKSIILTAILTALPSVLMAQENIQKAFDALLKDNIEETKTQHSIERDPETGRKTSQADVYDFVVSTPLGINHIKAIQKAFEKDKENAYQLRTVSHPGSDYMSLAVGDGRSQSVAIGRIKGSDYIYACFLDKDDPEKKYRYAYALEWLEKDKKTQVRLAVTYATTQQYRQKNSKVRKIIINGEEINLDEGGISFASGFPFGNSSVFDSDSVFFNRERSSESWLSEFNTYKKLFLKNPDGTAASHYATYIYKLCKNAKSLEEAEVTLVAHEIAKLKTSTNDEFIKQLFDMSIKRLGR
jgi:hypothetical protein